MMELKTKKTNIDAVSWLLRIGLAAVFLYAAVDAFHEPNAWLYFVPGFITSFIEPKTALDAISIVQIALAVWLISGKYLRASSLLAVGLLGGIIVFNLDNALTVFRDFGLACMAAALFFVQEK